MKKVILCAALVLSGQSKIVHADDTTIQFEELAAGALKNSPEAAQIDAALAERLSEAFSTRVKLNPELSASLDFPTSRRNGENTEIAASISQAIRPSDFGARTALSEIIEETGDIDKQIAIYRYIQSLSVLYNRAWQYQEIEGLLKNSQKRAAEFLGKVNEGSKTGIFSVGDVELFRAEQKSFESDSVAAYGEWSQTVGELTRLSGLKLGARKLGKPSDVLMLSKNEFERLARESRLPLQKRIQLKKELAQKQLEVARLDSFPTISPALGYSRHDDGIDQVTAGITMPLNIFNRNQAEKIKAQGALAAAESERRYATSDAVVQEVQLIYDSFQSIKRQVELNEKDIIPAKRRAIDAYYRQFDAGIGTAFQLWQSLRELNTSQMKAIELRAALASARAQINALVGKQL